MSKYKTDQEAFWAGEFGDEYIERNAGSDLIAANLAIFLKVLERTKGIKSLIEFGANRGLNLQALRLLLPQAELSAIEINQKAVAELEKMDGLRVYHQSILDFTPDYLRELSFIKGVLIHINPDNLGQVYERLYRSSSHYICLIEYYNPTPVEVSYRGHTGKLFKRDFAGEMLDKYPDLTLIDYGFCYRRDNNFPSDDATWFLLEKR
jgi:pseudaminic acid biosynthesis-associated methylase